MSSLVQRVNAVSGTHIKCNRQANIMGNGQAWADSGQGDFNVFRRWAGRQWAEGFSDDRPWAGQRWVV